MRRQSHIDTFFHISKGNRSTNASKAQCKQKTMIDVDDEPEQNLPVRPGRTLKKIKNENIINLDSDNEDIWDTSPNLWESSITIQGPDSEEMAYSLLVAESKREVSPNSNSSLKNISLKTNLSQAVCKDEDSDVTVSYSLSPTTPRNKHQTPTSREKPSPYSKLRTVSSPSSGKKYFSPSKQRSVQIRPRPALKRNLLTELGNTQPSTSNWDDIFTAACEGVDDKTVFLLKIIHQYLTDESLRHLLSSDSQTLLRRCFDVKKPGMRLVCRLYWRKEGWYRNTKIKQLCSDGTEPVDEPHMRAVLDSLVINGLFTEGGPDMTFDELITVLNAEELKQICKELKLKKQSKKQAVDALIEFSKRKSNLSNYFTGYTSTNSRRLLKIMSDKAGPCYKLSNLLRSTIYKLNVLMHLGMDYKIIREKTLELTLIYEKVNRETYPVDKSMKLDNASVVFHNQNDFERYMVAHCIYEDFLVKTDVQEKCNIVKQVTELYKEIGHLQMSHYKSLSTWLRRYTPAYLYVKIMEAGIEDLKKNKAEDSYLLATDILSMLISQTSFRQHKKADWYAEKALILHRHLQECDEAASVLLEGFRSNMSEEEKDIMRKRARILAKQQNINLTGELRRELAEHGTKENILEANLEGKHIQKQPMERIGNKHGKVLFETCNYDSKIYQGAEEYCISQYIYTEDYTDGAHWEGKIVKTIFFLLFWDIIYTKPVKVRGIFLSYYQRYPLDLFYDGFYRNRQQAIDVWLEVIEGSSEDKLIQMMSDEWQKRPEHVLSDIDRGSMSWQQVMEVVTCLGPRGVAAICSRLVRNYRYTHSGFPDLTLWNKHTKQIKFVEVKTDMDHPSMKQIQWMHYLREHNIATEFCYVGVDTTRQRSRANVTRPQRKTKRKKSSKIEMDVDPDFM